MSTIEVDQVSYTYPDGTPALRDVTFAVARGETVGMIGPNGAGKSTLLLHLNGLLPERLDPERHRREGRGADIDRTCPGLGSIRTGGLMVEPANLAAIRRMVGLVFQDPEDQLFCPTVREDVAFGPLNLELPRDEVLRRVRDALAAVGMPGTEDRLPHHLSLGERKRVCLAGVLACRPDILVMDEPTANLDPRARRQLIEIVGRLECTKLIASHDLELILQLCQRVLLLDGGRLRAAGPTLDILGDERLMLEHGLERPPSLRHTPRG